MVIDIHIRQFHPAVKRLARLPSFRRLYIESLESRRLLAGDTLAGIGLQAYYYSDSELKQFDHVETDGSVDFDWQAGGPGTVGSGPFSIRWTGQVEAQYTENYQFIVRADDAVRLWVNGQMLIDRWQSNPLSETIGTIDLIAGRRYDLQLEYADLGGDASIALSWQSDSLNRTLIPSNRLFPSERGTALREVWENAPGNTIADLRGLATYPKQPSGSGSISSLLVSDTQMDNFGQRIAGYLHPAQTGLYQFFVSANESAELWLSSSTDPHYATRIAQVTSPTPPQDWFQSTEQASVEMHLVAGQSYYFEALHKEGTGEDHLAIGWQRPGDSSVSIIGNEFISPLLPTVRMYVLSHSTSEDGSNAASLQIVRSDAPNNQPLTVHYALQGSAIPNVDFSGLTGTVVIPANSNSVSLTVTGIADGVKEDEETIQLELQSASGYNLGLRSERSAKLLIQDSSPAPSGGTSLLTGTALTNFTRFGANFSQITHPVHGTTIAVDITTQPAAPWDVQIRQANAAPIRAGEVLFAEFYARSPSGQGKMSVIYERNGDPYTKSLNQGITVSENWTLIQLPFVAAENYAIGEAAFALHLGEQVQTLQLANFNVRDYGPPATLFPESGFRLNNIGGSYGTMEIVPIAGQPFTSANRIQTVTVPPQVWHLQAVARSSGLVLANDQLEIEFWARAVAGNSPQATFVLQEAFGSFSTLLSRSLALTDQWQKFSYALTTARDYAPNELQIAINLGYTLQTVELAGAKWTNSGRFDSQALPFQIPGTSYDGRSGTDTWRTPSDVRIEENRKAELTIEVVDQFGNPVDGAVVSIRQQTHDFKFGSAISGYNNWLSPDGTAEALRYQAEIKRLFNTVTIENNLKWPDFLNNRQLGIDAVNWVIDAGLTLRGHNVLWPSRDVMPASVWSQYDAITDPAAKVAFLRNAVNDRILDASSTFAGQIWEWDIVNEPYANHEVMDVLGNAELLEWFRLFHSVDDVSKRTLNDYGIFSRNGSDTQHRANFDGWLQQLTSQSLIETIGEQSHYRESNLTDMEVLSGLIEHYASTYSVPITITEFDVQAGSQQLQADYLRDYLTMTFSQPGINAFVQWGFWSGAHWLPDSALYNRDFSPRLNGQVYEDLVFGNWWTDTRGTTRSGTVSANVFHGDYEVTVRVGNRTVTQSFVDLKTDQQHRIVLPGTQIILPIYQYPLSAPGILNTWWQQALGGATTETPLTIVANPSSGPIDPSHPDFTNWITALTQMRSNPNIQILGYVKTRVSPGSSIVRPSADIIADAQKYADLYRDIFNGQSLIDGIFLDEMSNDTANVSAYDSVANAIRGMTGLSGNDIFANPGTSVPIEYLDQHTADVFIIREGNHSDLVNNPIPDYVSSAAYAQLGFGAILYNVVGATGLAAALRDVKLREFDYAFITDDSLANPYDQAPTYFDQLLRDIHAPFLAAATFSLDENAPLGTVVGTPVYGDPDAGQSLTFTIVSGNANNAFSIDPTSGEIRVNNSLALNYEVTPLFTLEVQVSDNSPLALSDHNTIQIQLIDVAESSKSYIFYNNSAHDGTVGASASDDAALAVDKSPYIAGSGPAGYANYTNYSRGINGVFIDFPRLPGTPSASDFEFRMGNSQTPETWPLGPNPLSISVRAGAGLDGADRVTLIWGDGRIKDLWLQITVLATASTGLVTPDVFYWGNQVAETGDEVGKTRVDVADTLRITLNQSGFERVPTQNPFDIDRDQAVNVVDYLLSQLAQTGFVSLVLLDLNGSNGKTGAKNAPADTTTPAPAPVPPQDNQTKIILSGSQTDAHYSAALHDNAEHTYSVVDTSVGRSATTSPLNFGTGIRFRHSPSREPSYRQDGEVAYDLAFASWPKIDIYSLSAKTNPRQLSRRTDV
ncbi:MAG: endo-1,4-beta-xylanase [Planctomycetales bacterium]|nr:endo-1,4-beta-xylanase [Planctomycetales bacterium]